MARLIIIGPEGRSEKELGPRNTLGRHPNNTHQILDRIVSKEHCHIDSVGGAWEVRDLGSLNGTFLNGKKIQKAKLSDGDEIMIGSTRLVFHTEADGDAGSLPTDPPKRPSADQAAAAVSAQAAQAATVVAEAPSAAATAAPAAQSRSIKSVTIAPGALVQSHIRTKLAPLTDHNFLPERLVQDDESLRRDYEKLRASYEVMRAIGVQLDVDDILTKIIDAAFQLVPADRGVILLYDEARELTPRCVRTKRAQADGEEVKISNTLIDEVLRDKAAVLSSDASVDERFSTAHSIIMQGIRSSMAVPLLHGGEVFGIMVLDSQIAANAFTEKDLQLFQNVANQAAIAIQNSLYAKKLEAEAVTRERFQRLLSPAIAEQVLSGNVEVKKYGELRETTVLFSDIRGFTSMSEKSDPQTIVDMLNDYFERMVEIIFEYEGTLDKFVGDEIMALFGAPVSHPDDPYRAVKAARKMMDSLAIFNEERLARGQEAVQIGIGINSGEVIAGYLGSSKALEYTVIGDSVNTGARLCSAAGPGEILISEHTYARVKDFFEVEELPPTHVKGKAAALKIYRVVGETAAEKTVAAG